MTTENESEIINFKLEMMDVTKTLKELLDHGDM